MKRLQRLPLSPGTLGFLRKRSLAVAGATDPRSEAERLWKLRSNKAFDEIRTMLARMATGLERCMYCEDSQGTTIDHFWPKAAHPDLAFDWTNYLLGCSGCNSNFKRDQFPVDALGDPLLINPTEEDPLDHLAFSPSTGRYQPISSKGQSSVDVFGLDRSTLVLGRQRAWTNLKHLLIRYGQLRESGRESEAEEISEILQRFPFAGVLAAFVRIADGPAADVLIGQECLAVLQAHPEIQTWL
jgi:uncharacterized protein (TIGR02646 family)